MKNNDRKELITFKIVKKIWNQIDFTSRTWKFWRQWVNKNYNPCQTNQYLIKKALKHWKKIELN